MNHHPKWTAVRLAVLLGAISVLVTGCFYSRDHADARSESPHQEDKNQSDQAHQTDQDYHYDQGHP